MNKLLIYILVLMGVLPPVFGQSTAAADLRILRVSPLTNQLGGQVVLTLNDVSNLLAQASQKSKAISLFVNGIEMPDLHPNGIDPLQNTLSFQLQRTVTNKAVWEPWLTYPMAHPTHAIQLSVGLQGETPALVDKSARNAVFWVIGWRWWTISWLIVLGAIFIIFILLAIFSNILRAPEPDATGRHPYSLSRSQSAFWLLITAFSFVFIWAITGDVSTLNDSVLALIGISAGTHLISALVDVNNAKKAAAAPLPAPLPAPVGAPGAAPVNPTPMQKLMYHLQSIRFIGNFLRDILSDSKGVSIPRFQIFVWTIVLGIIFMVKVVNELSMPEFSGTLLGLMGISSATYVGNKMSE